MGRLYIVVEGIILGADIARSLERRQQGGAYTVKLTGYQTNQSSFLCTQVFNLTTSAISK